MPPDHPYPTPLDDCVAAYRALLRQCRPEDIVIGGPSAGANLAAATILRARDEGLPLPGGATLFSPAADLTESGDTWNTNFGVDTVFTARATAAFHLYAAGHDLRDPYLSPVFGDFGKGFPPTLLIAGTRDVLLSDTVRLHRALSAAGVPADLHVFEAAGHSGFLGMAPEDQEPGQQIRRFAYERWQAGTR
jgi:monoterpene epsilon-lactone hydrolase